MKKIISLLMLVCLLGSFAACGQQNGAVAIITPEPVTAQSGDAAEQAQVNVPEMAPVEQGDTANPDAETDADQASRSNSNNSNNSNNSGNSNTGTMSAADKLSTAQGYVGSSLSALLGAVGSPNTSEYVESCLEDASKEGMLYYDGFVVWTIQYNDGSEIVKGVS